MSHHPNVVACRAFSSAIEGNIMYESVGIHHPEISPRGFEEHSEHAYAAISGIADVLSNIAPDGLLYKYLELICDSKDNRAYFGPTAEMVIGSVLDIVLFQMRLVEGESDRWPHADAAYRFAEEYTFKALCYVYIDDPLREKHHGELSLSAGGSLDLQDKFQAYVSSARQFTDAMLAASEARETERTSEELAEAAKRRRQAQRRTKKTVTASFGTDGTLTGVSEEKLTFSTPGVRREEAPMDIDKLLERAEPWIQEAIEKQDREVHEASLSDGSSHRRRERRGRVMKVKSTDPEQTVIQEREQRVTAPSCEPVFLGQAPEQSEFTSDDSDWDHTYQDDSGVALGDDGQWPDLDLEDLDMYASDSFNEDDDIIHTDSGELFIGRIVDDVVEQTNSPYASAPQKEVSTSNRVTRANRESLNIEDFLVTSNAKPFTLPIKNHGEVEMARITASSRGARNQTQKEYYLDNKGNYTPTGDFFNGERLTLLKTSEGERVVDIDGEDIHVPRDFKDLYDELYYFEDRNGDAEYDESGLPILIAVIRNKEHELDLAAYFEDLDEDEPQRGRGRDSGRGGRDRGGRDRDSGRDSSRQSGSRRRAAPLGDHGTSASSAILSAAERTKEDRAVAPPPREREVEQRQATEVAYNGFSAQYLDNVYVVMHEDQLPPLPMAKLKVSDLIAYSPNTHTIRYIVINNELNEILLNKDNVMQIEDHSSPAVNASRIRKDQPYIVSAGEGIAEDLKGQFKEVKVSKSKLPKADFNISELTTYGSLLDVACDVLCTAEASKSGVAVTRYETYEPIVGRTIPIENLPNAAISAGVDRDMFVFANDIKEDYPAVYNLIDRKLTAYVNTAIAYRLPDGVGNIDNPVKKISSFAEDYDDLHQLWAGEGLGDLSRLLRVGLQSEMRAYFNIISGDNLTLLDDTPSKAERASLPADRSAVGICYFGVMAALPEIKERMTPGLLVLRTSPDLGLKVALIFDKCNELGGEPVTIVRIATGAGQILTVAKPYTSSELGDSFVVLEAIENY